MSRKPPAAMPRGWTSPAFWLAAGALSAAVYALIDHPAAAAVNAVVVAVGGVVAALYQIGHHSAKRSADRAAVDIAKQRAAVAQARVDELRLIHGTTPDEPASSSPSTSTIPTPPVTGGTVSPITG